MLKQYHVIVGNIGTVMATPDKGVATTCYDEYVEQSRNNVGRAAGESVTLECIDNTNHVESGIIEEYNPPTKSMLYWVAIYDVNKQYGGPEEGGWWYDAGELVDDVDIYDGVIPQCFNDEKAAIAHRDLLSVRAQAANRAEGRRPKSSVISTGEYIAEIHEGKLPESYPESKPHYE